MRNMLLALVSLPLLALSACGGEDAVEGPEITNQPVREFVLGIFESSTFDGLRLEFTTIMEEGRCPINATCVWEGNARILLSATRGRVSAPIELNTSQRFPTSAQFEGYLIELLRLDPLPTAPINGPLPLSEAYEATLRVTRATP